MKSTFWRAPRRIRVQIRARTSLMRAPSGARARLTLICLLLMTGTVVVAGQALSRVPEQANSSAKANSPSGTLAKFPKDVYPETGNRFPAIKREELDDAGKKLYDTRGVSDNFGPGAIRLYSPPVAESMSGINEYLRRKSGIEPRLMELAILVTAREMDCEYVWTAHEPAAEKAGLAQAVIDTVKFRKPVAGLAEKEAVIIELGRDSIGKHSVGSDTFARAVKLFGNQGVVNIVSLIGDYAATTILLNVSDQHIRPSEKPLLPIP
jgi:4-carboxymuconolactone decarboxylase